MTAPAAAPAHTDHPMRDWDRTCPACNPADHHDPLHDAFKAWQADPNSSAAPYSEPYMRAVKLLHAAYQATGERDFLMARVRVSAAEVACGEFRRALEQAKQ